MAGSVIEDGVTLGGLTVEGVEMGLVRHQEQHIQGFKADGIVGLAFPSISTTRTTSPSQHSTFVQLLQEQWGGAGDIFSVYLTREWSVTKPLVRFLSCCFTVVPTMLVPRQPAQKELTARIRGTTCLPKMD